MAKLVNRKLFIIHFSHYLIHISISYEITEKFRQKILGFSEQLSLEFIMASTAKLINRTPLAKATSVSYIHTESEVCAVGDL